MIDVGSAEASTGGRCPTLQGESLMEWLTSPEAWIALLTLTGLEIVLGVDNIIFISILVGPPVAGAAAAGARARPRPRDGHAHRAAAVARVDDAADRRRSSPCSASEITGRTLILVGGGLFLLVKSVMEIHGALEGADEEHAARRRARRLRGDAGADRHHRHRVLARLGDHGGGHGERRRGHGARDRHRGRRDDVRRAADRRFRRHAPDDQDAGARRS